VGKKFDEDIKKKIILDIEQDFAFSLPGIKKLPEKSRLGVLIAYYYYQRLLKIIRKTPAGELLARRVRVPDHIKILLLIKASLSRKIRYV
jgi:phytoene/squalene synthetase